MQPSPYTPGGIASEVPGRGRQLGEADERLSYMIDLGRLVQRIRVDHAARGVGKTSLLRQVLRHARDRDALTVWVTAGEHAIDLIGSIGRGIEDQAHGWRAETGNRVRQALDHMTLTLGVPGVAQVEVAGSAPASEPPTSAPLGVREFKNLLTETVAGAQREGRSSLVVFIDEIQESDPAGLRTLAYAWQELQSEAPDLRAAVFAAGLPNSPETLAAAVTFSERLFAYRQLDYLDDDATRAALIGPAHAASVEWTPDGLAAAAQIAQGYPYFVQLVGEASWVAAGYPDHGGRITADHVRAGQAAMNEDTNALFRARWEKATVLERRLMRAMAQLGDGPVQRAEVARLIGVTSYELSVPRQRLIDKGLVETAGRGTLKFPVPGFAAYIRTHNEDNLDDQ